MSRSAAGGSRLPLASLWFVLPVLLPLAAVYASLADPAADIWPHLAEYVLPRVAANTLWLVAGVALATAVLGTGLGALVSLCDFPGRRWFDWLLLLPLAAPGYVLAFVYIGLFDTSGTVPLWLRAQGLDTAALPAFRSRGGVTLVLTLVLYPYVYLLARQAFLSQGARAMEAARTLGLSPLGAFFHAALPLARPWIAGGVGLVAMETLADFGTVAAFNYDTFTTAIYKTWFALFSLPGAMQLSAVLVTVVLVVLLLEQELRRRRRYTTTGRSAPARRFALRGAHALAATAACSLVLLLAFALPMLQLVLWSIDNAATELTARYAQYLGRTLLLAAGAAVLITACAVMFSYILRQARGFPARLVQRIATLGYALPGPVLAVGFFAAVAAFSNASTALRRALGDPEAAAWYLQGSLLVLFAAYLARFFAVGLQPVDAALARVRPAMDEAARSLGASRVRVLRHVHLPLIRSGVLSGLVLAFVDVLKDMPVTLMLRPFGWETLAVRVFELTSEGEYARAALPAVAIVLAGLIPVMLLMRRSADAT